MDVDVVVVLTQMTGNMTSPNQNIWISARENLAWSSALLLSKFHSDSPDSETVFHHRSPAMMRPGQSIILLLNSLILQYNHSSAPPVIFFTVQKSRDKRRMMAIKLSMKDCWDHPQRR